MKAITQQDWYGAIVAVLLLSLLLSIASPYFLTNASTSGVGGAT
jgi:ribose transport system permease protein